MELELPLDSQGFLRRQCPHCEREFKWHHGPTDAVPQDAVDPEEYFCPYCGGAAGVDEWWTEEQVEAIQAAVLTEVMPRIAESLDDATRPINRSGLVTTSVHYDAVNPPPPLEEVDDMIAVASPCHSYEPVKIDGGWNTPIHCLVCGAQFAI